MENMAKQILFSEEKFFKYLTSKGVRNILGKVVSKRSDDKSNSKKVTIPIVYTILSNKTNFQNKILTKGQKQSYKTTN